MDLIRNSTQSLETLRDILRIQASTIPNSVAVIFEDREYTYKELHQIVLIKVNDILKTVDSINSIGVLLPRGINYIIAYFVAAELGVKFVPINLDSTSSEISQIIDYCDIDFVIHDNKSFELVDNINGIKKMNIELQDVFLEPIDKELNKLKTSKLSSDSVALLLHTSGSTSAPKRVMLTHKNIISNAKAHVLHMKLFPNDNVLIAIPMHFGYCNTAQFIAHFLLGSKLILLDGIFSPQKFLKLTEKYKVNVCTLVPTMLSQITAYKYHFKYDTSSLHQITFGGSPFTEELLINVKKIFPNTNLCATYGLTEAGPRISGVSPGTDGESSVGTLLPGISIKILNENQQPVQDHEVGEIWVKSLGVMKGYYKRTEETNKVMSSDGEWLNTGDLGRWYMDKLYIVGRVKNVVIRAGVNIYPEEIESYLKEHPKVKDVYVKGLKHPILGETPHAFILRDDLSLTYDEVKKFAQKGLSSYKIPTFEFKESFTYTYNNKIKRC